MKTSLIAGLIAIVIGVGLFALPTPGEPELLCVEEGTPSSGFVDEDQDGCPVSIESWNEYSDWNSSPKIDNIAGLVLVVAGLGIIGAGFVRSRRST